MRRLALAALALLAMCAPANAQSTTIQAPYATCVVTTTSPTICYGAVTGFVRAHNLLGVANNSLAAQTATVTIYDNATGLCSGTVAASIGPLGVTQIVAWPPPGRPVLLGMTACASAAPSGAGIEIYAR